jgi:RNA polymerase sigma factor (sigma-70 family)
MMTESTTDGELLAKYADTGCEESFCRLVERYLPLVQGVALHRTGRREWAEDIAMHVFAQAARKAHALSRRASLGGWFVLATRMQAAQALRQERSRLRLMEKAAHLSVAPHSDPPASAEESALPFLDDALARLSEKERDTVVLHFYNGLSYREIAARERRSEDAPRKRTVAALQKMSRFFQQRGLTLSVAALTSAMAAEWDRGQSVGAARIVAQKALALAPSLSGPGIALVAMRILKPAAAVAGFVMCVVPLIGQHQEISATRANIAALEKIRRAERSQPLPLAPVARSAPTATAPRVAGSEIDLAALAGDSLAAREGDAVARGRVRRILDPLDSARLISLLESAAAHGFPRDHAEAVTDSLLRALVSKNPEQAAKFSVRFARAELLLKSLKSWATASPQAALAWFKEQKAAGTFQHKDSFAYPNMEHEATKGVAIALFIVDRAGAKALIDSIAPGDTVSVLQDIGEEPERTASDYAEIAALAARLSSPKKLNVLMVPAIRIAQENRDDAAAFIRSLALSPSEQRDLLVFAAGQSESDGASLTSRLAWLAEETGPELASGAQGQLLARSLRDDVSTAGQIEDIFTLMRQMRAALDGDDLLAQFLEHSPVKILYERTEEWLALAASLPPGKAREQQLKWANAAAAKAASQPASAKNEKR